MFLRSLTLKGFKSFAEPTTLELEPGLTVVVGPNGSGKSNIVDAVAWVLGAQGPRTMRSSRMEDVIFAGNGRRPALGRAEVTLTIDNAAGLLPIGFTEVTLTRTLFRSSGESEYAINGVPCRLLDLQELLSDTGVGRQQHVIVSQGNLDQVLDVRPEDRRLIVEEAAGILKFRRRKEKAGRRLEATEAHLVRLTDLLREQRRQMRPLERQAEAARRHDELAAELRALRLHLAGRSLATLTARAEAGERERSRLVVDEASAQAQLRSLDRDISSLETRLMALDDRHLDSALSRLESLRERARGLGAVLAERLRSLEAVVAAADGGDDAAGRLQAEAEVLAAELAAAEEDGAALADASAGLAEAEADLVRRREELAVREAAERAVGQAAEARGELAALRAAAERARAEGAELEREVAGAELLVSQRDGLAAAARSALAAAVQHEAEAATTAAAEGAEAAAAERAREQAEERTRFCERKRDELVARVEALTLATGTPAVSERRPGVLGLLLELVEIESGWEAAVDAALGDALAAVVVDGEAAARQVLAAGEAAVLVAALPPAADAGETTVRRSPGEPARDEVRAKVCAKAGTASAEVGALLDRLLAGAVVAPGGWEAALDLALAEPELVVVTRAGDRFSPRGWRLRGGGARVAAALTESRRDLEVARTEARAAAAAEDDQRRAAQAARRVHEDAQAALRRAQEEATARRAELARLEAEHQAAKAEAARVRQQLESRARRLEAEERRAARLEERLAEVARVPEEPEGPDAATRPEVDLASQRGQVAEQAQALAARRAQLTAQAEASAQRRADLSRRLHALEAHLAEARARSADARARAAQSLTDLARTRRLAEARVACLRRIDVHLTDLRQRRQRRVAAAQALVAELEQRRRARSEGERQLEDVRARARRAELEAAEDRMRLEAARDAVRRDLDCEPHVALAAECPPLPAGSSPSGRARDLERELRLLGPVNPLAVEELAALEERHTFLAGQLEDVKATRRDLARVIRSVEAEMTELLAAAYADVADNFADLFETLFPGGEGRLRLTEPERILDSGIEIEARPGGKSPRKLSLLSGGERSLCALAFLFAVFRSRPSPFYLLDEVEAALDDVNLHRFLRLLDEFRGTTQLLVVTHQKRTMEAADCLFGVTMQPGGTSRVLSERVRAAG